jgi:DNA-binding NarL/FixJ family response regulator
MMRSLKSPALAMATAPGAAEIRQPAIVLIDSQPLFLDALVAALLKAWPDADIAVARDFRSGVAKLGATSPDIVLANVETSSDVEAYELEGVVRAAKDAPVIATSHRIDGDAVARALAAGARGYLPKTMTGEAICGAIMLALSGGVCLPPQALANVVGRGPSPVRAPRSRREAEILTHLARGASNKAIARDLGISVATVKLHVQSILRATGAKNRTEAIANARRMGMLVPD